MAPWIKRPKVGDRELQNRRQGFARAKEFGLDDETPQKQDTYFEKSPADEDLDGLFEEPQVAGLNSAQVAFGTSSINSANTTFDSGAEPVSTVDNGLPIEEGKEEQTMSSPTQEELFKQQMEQFMANSAILQNLIDSQNMQNAAMTGNVAHMPNMQVQQPAMPASNSFVQPNFAQGFPQSGYVGTGYTQPIPPMPPQMPYGQPVPPMGYTQPMPAMGGFVQTPPPSQNVFSQYNSGYQPQASFQPTAPMPDLSQTGNIGMGYEGAAEINHSDMNVSINPTRLNPSESATPLQTPLEAGTEGFPRYPYPSPDMQPGMGQMPSEGIDGIMTGNTPSYVAGIHTVDLTGIADDIKTTVDARVDGLQTDVYGIRTDVDAMKIQVDSVRQGIDAVQTNVTGIRCDVEAIRSDFTSDLSGIQDEIRKQMEAATADIAHSTRTYFEESKASLEETRSALAEANKTIERNTESFAGLKEQLDLLTSRTETIDNVSEKMDMSMSELKTDLSEKIHTEDVKCFRNIQSSMKEQSEATDAGFNNLANQIADRLIQTETRVDDHSKKITAVLVISIISFVGVIGVLLLEAGLF